jgi:hypothetical protein
LRAQQPRAELLDRFVRHVKAFVASHPQGEGRILRLAGIARRCDQITKAAVRLLPLQQRREIRLRQFAQILLLQLAQKHRGDAQAVAVE